MNKITKTSATAIKEYCTRISIGVLSKPPKIEISEKAVKIRTLIAEGRFDDRPRKALINILSELIGEKIPEINAERNDINTKPGQILVPLRCDNNHDYPIGKPCIIYSGANGFKLNGNGGNNLGLNRDAVREPTLEEIDLLFESINDLPNKLMGYDNFKKSFVENSKTLPTGQFGVLDKKRKAP
jgi:hypothetical protein